MIKVRRNDDGLWIEFTTVNGGKSAMVNVETMAEKQGPIVGLAIREACEEAAALSAPAPAGEVVGFDKILDGLPDELARTVGELSVCGIGQVMTVIARRLSAPKEVG